MRRDRISAGANEAMAIAHGFWPAAEKARPAAFYWSRPSTLVGGLDMGLLGELQHLGEVFSEEFTELIDAHLLWLDAELGELLAQRRVVERFLRDVVQLVHDAARSLSGRRIVRSRSGRLRSDIRLPRSTARPAGATSGWESLPPEERACHCAALRLRQPWG